MDDELPDDPVLLVDEDLLDECDYPLPCGDCKNVMCHLCPYNN